MSKITLALCKVFKNSGSLRFHRKKTKKHWKHYFIDSDDGSVRAVNTGDLNQVTVADTNPFCMES